MKSLNCAMRWLAVLWLAALATATLGVAEAVAPIDPAALVCSSGGSGNGCGGGPG